MTLLRGVTVVMVVLNQTQHFFLSSRFVSIYFIMVTLFVHLIRKLVVHTSVSPIVFCAVVTGVFQMFGQLSYLSINVSFRG